MRTFCKWKMRAFIKGLPFVIFITLVVPGCEQTVDVELPYERMIVVNTFVGRTMDSLAWISRTLPATDEARYEDAAITDASVKIIWRDTVYQLLALQSRRGFLLPPPDPRWQGDSMRMVVEWEGLRAESVARMPIAPTIIDARVEPKLDNPEYRTIVVTLRIRPGCVVWLDPSNISEEGARPPMNEYPHYLVVPGNPNDSELEVTVTTGDRYSLSPGGPVKVKVKVCAADLNYAQFLAEPNRRSDDPFSFGGARAYTNVTGHGIGMFVPVVSVSDSVGVK